MAINNNRVQDVELSYHGRDDRSPGELEEVLMSADRTDDLESIAQAILQVPEKTRHSFTFAYACGVLLGRAMPVAHVHPRDPEERRELMRQTCVEPETLGRVHEIMTRIRRGEK